ncbi:hypothetical protein ULMA_29000 [Patiriisocius marinus]|uniref:Uncharacterized protein n=1 Tax=Patiriisocius marinus TaxID=1397112 RepID=A0A5J4J1M7_9FLAO|nr:FecR family protein [Patiriisocius marinus]GER60792.1 hypothetical protein ULMA_29000 [Patiriisocius marinus]
MNKEQLIKKWLNGECSAQEIAQLKTLPEFAMYEKIDAKVKLLETPQHDVSAGLTNLKNQENFRKKSNTKVKYLSFQTISKIAAILIVLVASGIFLTTVETSVNGDLAAIEKVSLPDNSRISLSENASVSYKKYNWHFERNVELTGEAFFEVAKGKTFTVTTPQGVVTVLGTKFNVETTETGIIVTCYEGLVSVTSGITSVKVEPGERYEFNNKAFTKHKVYTTHPTWIFNESSFTDQDLYSVLMELENEYNITVNTKNIDVNLRYTGTFTHSNLDDALRTITVPLNLSYSKDTKNGVLIYDSRKKE